MLSLGQWHKLSLFSFVFLEAKANHQTPTIILLNAPLIFAYKQNYAPNIWRCQKDFIFLHAEFYVNQ